MTKPQRDLLEAILEAISSKAGGIRHRGFDPAQRQTLNCLEAEGLVELRWHLTDKGREELKREGK